MLEKDLINTWICYKISNGEREELKSEDNTSEMSFLDDGRLTYRFIQPNQSQSDGLDRHWKIDYQEETPVILINGVPTYQIVSLEGGVLILESIKGDGFRHFYADRATISQKSKLV